MLDENGIEQLKEIFATKDELKNSLVAMETRIYSQIDAMHKEMRSNYEALINNSDKMLGIISIQRQEQILIIKDQEKHEKWIDQLAKKIELELK